MESPEGKYVNLDAALYAYMVAHRTPDDDVLRDLRRETLALGDRSVMQIAPEQGTFLGLLVACMGARRAVEIGTFTGYSALCIARGLPPDGSLLCCDVSETWTSVARRYWKRAGVETRIDLRLAPALETLRALPNEPDIDFAFIDADKVSYVSYYEELLPRLRPGGLVVADNVLWSGRVTDLAEQDADTQAIRAFNDHVARDPRVTAVMLPVADGLLLARKHRPV